MYCSIILPGVLFYTGCNGALRKAARGVILGGSTGRVFGDLAIVVGRVQNLSKFPSLPNSTEMIMSNIGFTGFLVSAGKKLQTFLASAPQNSWV